MSNNKAVRVCRPSMVLILSWSWWIVFLFSLQRTHVSARTFQVSRFLICSQQGTELSNFEIAAPLFQEKTPSGLNFPSRRTLTLTATESSMSREPGTANLLESSCATPSGTRSTWVTPWTVSVKVWSWVWSGCWFWTSSGSFCIRWILQHWRPERFQWGSLPVCGLLPGRTDWPAAECWSAPPQIR